MNACSYTDDIKQTFGGIDMEKNLAEQYSTFFSKKISLVSKSKSIKPFSQMPEPQITYFLTQAYERKKSVILQMNKTEYNLFINEQIGIIKHIENKRGMLVLESSDCDLIHMLSFNDIRHIRLS